MREIAEIAIVIGVMLSWLAIWAFVIRLWLGFPGLSRKPEDRLRVRQWIKKIGRLKYTIIYGVFGAGFAFALGMTTFDWLGPERGSWGWLVAKFLFLSTSFGVPMGPVNWGKIP
jgi:hypothetical protein